MTPRVLHVVDQFLRPSETFVYTVVGGHRGFDATVLCHGRECTEQFPFARVHVEAIPRSKKDISWWIAAAIDRATGRSPWRRRVEAFIGTLRPDVIHAHFGPLGCEMIDIAKTMSIPLVTSLYGVDAAVLPYLPHWREAYARLFRDGDRFLAEGPEMRKKIVAAGAPDDRTRLQPIGIDVSKYPRWAPTLPPTVLFVGRFVEKKGLRDAIRAFGSARAQFAGARFVIVGAGPDEAEARQLVDSQGLTGVVEFAGMRPHADVIARLAAATVFLHPSVTARDGDSEGGAPTILLEAQAVGVPIVSTRHADIPTVAPEGAGTFLCDEHDVDALADALVRAIRHRQPSSRSHVAAHHDIASTIVRLEDAYRALL